MQEPKADIQEKTFDFSWEDITEMSAKLQLSGVCNSCPNSNICHPCAAIAYTETGETSGIPNYMCRFSQEMQRIAREELHV